MAKATDRRLRTLALSALALLTAVGGVSVAAVGEAQAQGYFRGGGYERAAYQERGRGSDRSQARGRERGEERGYDTGRYGGRGYGRGAVLPQDYRDREVADPGRYHLRRPPSGYGWVGDERNAYLMQRSTGMVLDAVPGAYDPPPEYRARRRR